MAKHLDPEPQLHQPPRLLDRRSLLGAGLGGMVAALWAKSPVTVGAAPGRTQAPMPAIEAAAAFAIDIDAGTELFALEPDQRRPTGSTIKIATALVVMANAALDETVVIDASDQVDETIYSHMGLVAGDTVSVQQLLYGLLLPSGSDAARALARHVGAKLAGLDPAAVDPARAAFAVAMNELAVRLGAQNSHFVNASGDDDPNQHSTARDLAILATALLADQALAEIVRTPTWESVSLGPEQRYFQLQNVNILLTEDPAVIGVKTGSTPDAGTCLVSARQIGEGNRVVTVVLGCLGRYEDGYLVEDGRWDATRSLVSAMTTEYSWISLAGPEHLPGLSEELAVWQATVDPRVAQPVPTAAMAGLRYRLVLGPEGEPGSEVGRIMLFSGSEVIGERPVFQAGGSI
jgi:D-alanyl-D-alanine carboxypeptidase (penicillin-binding protein 5/6)